MSPLREGREPDRRRVTARFAGLEGAEVTLALEVEATVQGGVPEQLVGTVAESSRTPRFGSFGFEEESRGGRARNG